MNLRQSYCNRCSPLHTSLLAGRRPDRHPGWTWWPECSWQLQVLSLPSLCVLPLCDNRFPNIIHFFKTFQQGIYVVISKFDYVCYLQTLIYMPLNAVCCTWGQHSDHPVQPVSCSVRYTQSVCSSMHLASWAPYWWLLLGHLWLILYFPTKNSENKFRGSTAIKSGSIR